MSSPATTYDLIRNRLPADFLHLDDSDIKDPEAMYVLLQGLLQEDPSRSGCIVPILSEISALLDPQNLYENAWYLYRNGYVVIPMLDTRNVRTWRTELMETIRSFPEYKDTKYPVLGGFGALGNPSSFHHPWIRRKRVHVYHHARATILRDMATILGEEESLRSELLFDRILWRKKGQTPTREAWHRDVVAKPPRSTLHKGDTIFGGWTNLDDTDQYFSCVPGTHHDMTLNDTVHSGFSKIAPVDRPAYKVRSVRVTIPSGHCLFFYQHLVHEVVATPAKVDMYRIFHGIRCTHGTRPLFEQDYLKRRVFSDQSIPRLPSFQLPPVYSSNHSSCLLGLPRQPETDMTPRMTFTLPGQSTKTNTIEWSKQTFNTSCLEDRICKRQGIQIPYTIVSRYMKSLTEYGFTLFPVYTRREQMEYTPRLLHAAESHDSVTSKQEQILSGDDETSSESDTEVLVVPKSGRITETRNIPNNNNIKKNTSNQQPQIPPHEGKKPKPDDTVTKQLISRNDLSALFIRIVNHLQQSSTYRIGEKIQPFALPPFLQTEHTKDLIAADIAHENQIQAKPSIIPLTVCQRTPSTSGKGDYLALKGVFLLHSMIRQTLPPSKMIYTHNGREVERVQKKPKFMMTGKFYYYQNNTHNRRALSAWQTAQNLLDRTYAVTDIAPLNKKHGILNWDVNCGALSVWQAELTHKRGGWDEMYNPILQPDGTIRYNKNGIYRSSTQTIINVLKESDRTYHTTRFASLFNTVLSIRKQKTDSGPTSMHIVPSFSRSKDSFLQQSKQNPDGVAVAYMGWAGHAHMCVAHKNTLFLYDPWMSEHQIQNKRESRHSLQQLKSECEDNGFSFQLVSHSKDQTVGEGSCAVVVLSRMIMVCLYGMEGIYKSVDCHVAIFTHRLMSLYRTSRN